MKCWRFEWLYFNDEGAKQLNAWCAQGWIVFQFFPPQKMEDGDSYITVVLYLEER